MDAAGGPAVLETSQRPALAGRRAWALLAVLLALGVGWIGRVVLRDPLADVPDTIWERQPVYRFVAGIRCFTVSPAPRASPSGPRVHAGVEFGWNTEPSTGRMEIHASEGPGVLVELAFGLGWRSSIGYEHLGTWRAAEPDAAPGEWVAFVRDPDGR